MPVDEIVREVLVAGQPLPVAADMNPGAWVKRFETWTPKHEADNPPVLSDEAISCDIIYRERGL